MSNDVINDLSREKIVGTKKNYKKQIKSSLDKRR